MSLPVHTSEDLKEVEDGFSPDDDYQNAVDNELSWSGDE